MKRRIILVLVFIFPFIGQTVMGQTYSTSLSNRESNGIELSISQSDLSIQGHNSNEVIIENTDYTPQPARAQGLRSLYGGGEDNTGIGLSVEEVNGVLKIVQIGSPGGNFIMKVPNKLRLMVEEINWGGGDVEIRNHNGEIEVKSKNGDVTLQNITGPVVLGSTSGDVDITFARLSNATPSSISLVSGYIDVTLPSSAQADFNLSSISGEIYSDLDIRVNDEKKEMRSWGGRTVRGTLNGGGVQMELKTISGDIFLRKAN